MTLIIKHVFAIYIILSNYYCNANIASIASIEYNENGSVKEKDWEVEFQISGNAKSEELIKFLKTKPYDTKCGKIAVE